MSDHPVAVFVYGTLKRGEVRERCWPRRPLSIEPATTLGELYNLGPYPALLEGDNLVLGEFWRLRPEDLSVTLRVLDEVECFGGHDNDLYTRKVVTCRLLSDGSEQSAHCYFLANRATVRPTQRIVPTVLGAAVTWARR